MAMTEPRYMPLIAYPDAWSPSTRAWWAAAPVYIGDKSAEQIQAIAGQLRGAIVLTHLAIRRPPPCGHVVY